MDDTEVQAVAPQEETKPKDLYTKHIEGFIENADEDLERALGRYGFTLWHSLPQKEQVTLKERLRFQPLRAADYYNRGTALAMEGNFEEAETDLKAALKHDRDHSLAAFNLAVCLEKMERFDEARDAYDQYVQILDRARGRRDLRLGTDEEIDKEVARIRQYLNTLGKA